MNCDYKKQCVQLLELLERYALFERLLPEHLNLDESRKTALEGLKDQCNINDMEQIIIRLKSLVIGDEI
jgi:hypothetical protein